MKNKSVGPRASETAGRQFQTFEDLEAYKAAREFRKAMYGMARSLPDFEKFGLTSQVRRAALSLTNNIAEGHGRFHYLDQIKFMLQARGSLQELIDDLNVCEDEKYLPSTEVAALKEQGWHVLKFINGCAIAKPASRLVFVKIQLPTVIPTRILKPGSRTSLCNSCNDVTMKPRNSRIHDSSKL